MKNKREEREDKVVITEDEAKSRRNKEAKMATMSKHNEVYMRDVGIWKKEYSMLSSIMEQAGRQEGEVQWPDKKVLIVHRADGETARIPKMENGTRERGERPVEWNGQSGVVFVHSHGH